MTTPDYSTLDEALELLRPFGAELHNGNSNHAPMAAEAMCALGRPDAVLDWVDRYRRNLEPARTPHELIKPAEWRNALGHQDRIADWRVFLENELAEHPWPEVLDRWVARLAPGIIAAAAHGAIRTAHAARSLAVQKSDLRLRELAGGLAYWAAEYQTLPGGPDSASQATTSGSVANSASGGAASSAQRPVMSPARAIEAIELLPLERRCVLTSLTGALPALDTFDPFRDVISTIEVPRDPAAILSQLTNGFADVLLANATSPLLTIAFVHCVTALYAVRNLAPHLSTETTQSAVRYGWQAAAALYTTIGQRPHPVEEHDPPKFALEDLVDRALRSRDEHAIKYTEACLAEYSLAPSPIYLRAADHAIRLLTLGN
ncbi:MAG TPA: questin oxidase family protein [Candidatus Binataceae bacterium]